MATRQRTAILRHIGKLVAEQKICQASDRELLLRFTKAGDEAAFAAILQRHGAMVLRVCRRLLADSQDADDAFQAVFLVLLRRASLLRWRDSVGGWLHQVAYRVAQHMRKQYLRRRVHEARAAARLIEAARDDVSVREAQAILHEELHRLPERLRAPLVLCYLESATQDEAARRLGWSLRTLKRRLECGRALLHGRLTRRGLTLATVLSTGLLTDVAASTTLAHATLAWAASFLAGRTAVSPAVRAAVTATLRGMLLSNLRVAGIFIVLLATGFTFTGNGGHTNTLSGQEHEAARTPQRQVLPNRTAQRLVGRDHYGDPLPPGALARLGTIRFRQQTAARALAFSTDGKFLAGRCPLLGTVLWESATGRQLHSIPGGLFDFPPDGKTLATVDESGDISLWEIASGKKLRTIPYSGGYPRPAYIRFSPNGKVIACFFIPNNIVALLDAASGKLLHTVGGRPATVYKAVFSPDSKRVLLATHTPCLELWDVATGKLLRRIADQTGRVAFDAVFSPDGKLIAASLWEELALFDALTGKEVFRLPRKFKTRLSGLGPVFTPDGKKLVFHGDSKIWNLDITGKTLHGGFDAPGEFPALSPDGTTVALSSSSRIRLWDVASGKELFRQFEGHHAPATGLFFSADNRTLFSIAEDRQVRIWDTVTGQESGRLCPNGRATSVSPDGKRLVLVRNDKKSAIGVWDLVKRGEVLTLQPPDMTSKKDYVVRALHNLDATGLISLEYRRPPQGTEWGDSRLIIWDAVTGRPRRHMLLRSVAPGALALASDGRTAFLIKNDQSAQYYSGAILCIDLQQGRVFRSLKTATYDLIPEGLAISPDGKLLASASYDCNVRVWETDSGQEVFALAGGQPALAVAFSPDGRVLATAGSVLGFASSPKGPQTIRLWDIVSGVEIGRLQGHDADVNALVFSLDGEKLFSAQKDSTVLIWDMTRMCPAPLKRVSLSQADLQKLWADLGADNARQAHQASWKLVANPDQAVSLLKAKVKPVSPVDPAHVRRLIADLDSQQFQVREVAQRRLQLLDRQAEQPLRQALAETPSLELRRRVEKVLDSSSLPPSVLRDLRAVTTLERIGSHDARKVLESLGKGVPDARLSEAAKMSLKRLTWKKV